jgi:superfamily II DNA helicase RecQ
MNQRQLLGAYFSDVLMSSIKAKHKDKAIQATYDLLHSLSFFETNLPEQQIKLELDSIEFSVVSILNNFIQRGLPTHSSILVEEYLQKFDSKLSKEISDIGGIEFKLNDVTEDFTLKLYLSLFIIDSRIDAKQMLSNQFWKNWLGSELEKKFLLNYIIPFCGSEFIQLIECQRSITNILQYNYHSGENIKELYNQPLEDFGEQRTDFAIELPCVLNELESSKKGLVMEVDGSQHLNNRAQHNLDQYRDYAISCLQDTQWATIRARSNEWQKIPILLENFKSFFQDKYFQGVKRNLTNPLWKDESGLIAQTIALLPIAVARIHRVLIELILNKKLNLKDRGWHIGIVEQDVDCAWIAIKDFEDQWNRICNLAGIEINLPTIELSVYSSKEYIQMHHSPINKMGIEMASDFIGHVLIDVSVLQRWGVTEPINTKQQVDSILIRSSHSKKILRSYLSAPLLIYPPLIHQFEDRTDLEMPRIKDLNYFVRTAFRKNLLRPGQLPIISKALQNESVIGLLPTGGGKSITYQICGLLQPGICLVIDPIKSLMQDQNLGLKKNNIDATVFVNSSIKTYYERKWAMEQLTKGRVLFAFISPERLQIPTFRDALSQMHVFENKYFNYCVIDEAHCVSEWGHDFRTSYLKLGENARRFCKTWKQTKTISLFGLTATASFDVLSDVKRELQIGEENVVRNLDSNRVELIYKIHSVKTDLSAKSTGFQASQAVGEAKVEAIRKIILDLPDNVLELSNETFIPKGFTKETCFQKDIKDKFNEAVLVFCPHKSGKSPAGVNYLAPKLLSIPRLKIGTFFGTDKQAEKSEEINTSETFQSEFIENKINLLIATKAFGMGIDKPNIRSTIHFNFPSSIESFVQEAGRAGRDRKRAICHVLYSNAKNVDAGIIESFHANNFKGEEHDLEVIKEILEEISYPSIKVKNDLNSKIFEELSETVQINNWTDGKNVRLYVNRAFGISYGFIDLNTKTKNTNGRHPEISVETANEVLDFVVKYINEKCPYNQNRFEWLNSEVIANKHPGIETLLNKVNVGQELPDIEVGFSNDRKRKITELLKVYVHESITEQLVANATNFATKYEDLIANLKKEFQKQEGFSIADKFPLDKDIEAQLLKYFQQIREEADTFKAIYRLTVLGVIDDYEVDYSSKSIRLKIKKKTDDDYQKFLISYLSRYLSPKRVTDLINDVPQKVSESKIRTFARILIRYVYRYIGSKRERAIREMQELCEEGITSKSHDEIQKRIELYFNSKYTNDLIELTNSGKLFSIEMVSKYLQETRGMIDNLEHLRGSTSRILSDSPDNGAMLVLRAYSSILLETRNIDGKLFIRNKFLLEKAIDDLEKGIQSFREIGVDEMSVLNLIRNDLLNHNNKISEIIDELTLIFSIKGHTKWLKEFNNKFIK